MKENEGHIFRFWTWKKFFSFLLFYFINFSLIGFILEILFNNGDLDFNFKETFVESCFQTFVFSCLSTLWTPEKESIFTLLKRKFKK